MEKIREIKEGLVFILYCYFCDKDMIKYIEF